MITQAMRAILLAKAAATLLLDVEAVHAGHVEIEDDAVRNLHRERVGIPAPTRRYPHPGSPPEGAASEPFAPNSSSSTTAMRSRDLSMLLRR